MVNWKRSFLVTNAVFGLSLFSSRVANIQSAGRVYKTRLHIVDGPRSHQLLVKDRPPLPFYCHIHKISLSHLSFQPVRHLRPKDCTNVLLSLYQSCSIMFSTSLSMKSAAGWGSLRGGCLVDFAFSVLILCFVTDVLPKSSLYLKFILKFNEKVTSFLCLPWVEFMFSFEVIGDDICIALIAFSVQVITLLFVFMILTTGNVLPTTVFLYTVWGLQDTFINLSKTFSPAFVKDLAFKAFPDLWNFSLASISNGPRYSVSEGNNNWTWHTISLLGGACMHIVSFQLTRKHS